MSYWDSLVANSKDKQYVTIKRISAYKVWTSDRRRSEYLQLLKKRLHNA